MAHNCQSIIIHCMDFRLVEKIRDWMSSQGYLGDADVVSLAGACKAIADDDPSGREIILKQIEISIRLHHSCRVIILHHSDCGAYKGSCTFSSFEEEKARHAEDMEKAAKVIKERFPEMEVMKVLAVMEDCDGKEVEFVKL